MNAAVMTLGKELVSELFRDKKVSETTTNKMVALSQSDFQDLAAYIVQEDLDDEITTPQQLVDYLMTRCKHEVAAVLLALRLDLRSEVKTILVQVEPALILEAYNSCLENMAYRNHLEATLLMLDAIRLKFQHCQDHFPAPVMEAARASQKLFLEELSACIEYTNEEEPTPPDQVRLREAVSELEAEF